MEVTKNEIQKVSIKNERCNVSFKESAGNELNVVNKECGAIVHKDLMAALNKLKVHLVVLCEQPESNKINHDNIDDFDLTLLDNYVITGYTIGGTDEHEGVTIVAQKLLKSGKVLNIVSPFTKYEDDYEFASELGLDVKGATYEVEQYLFNDKFGIKQQEMDFGPEVNLKSAAEGIMTIEVSDRKKSKKKKGLEKVEEIEESTY